MNTKQYECENVVQVAHKVAELTNTYLDCQTWNKYCEKVKKDGSNWFDYRAFDSHNNKSDVSIFLGYDKESQHYFVFADYGKRLVSDFLDSYDEKSELNTNYDDLADEKFHQLTKTLIKSLFKAIGTDETRKIPFIISNNMVFFNYNGIQYKYYPSQCKVFKKCGRKYQRINWKNFTDDNSPNDQKQARAVTPDL